MSGSEQDRDAALLAAGALTPEETEALLARRRVDPGFSGAVEAWELALAPLAAPLAPIEPPGGLLDKIEARLDAGGTSASRSVTVRAAEGQWIAMGPGIRIKLLHQNMATRRQTILLVADPGATNPAHVHDSDEGLYVVSGDIVIDGEELGPGDYHFSPALSRHPMETTRRGCTCVITMGF